jgi:hypothetical protein
MKSRPQAVSKPPKRSLNQLQDGWQIELDAELVWKDVHPVQQATFKKIGRKNGLFLRLVQRAPSTPEPTARE